MVVTAASVAVSCSDAREGSVTRASFERHLVDRMHITRDQAACVARYSFAEYSPDEVVRLDRSGLTGVGPDRWSGYAQALMACSLRDQIPPRGRPG